MDVCRNLRVRGKVTQFLTTLALDLIESPYLAKIGRKCSGKYNRKNILSVPFPLPALHERQLKRTHEIAAFIR
jgi:hypothetical protein